MSEKLLPCPLCGPGQVSLNPPSETYRYGSINCPGCMLTLPGEIKDQREMIEVWNTRPDHAPARLRPVAWRWRHGNGPWSWSEEKPTGPSVHLFEVEPLYATRDEAQQSTASTDEGLASATAFEAGRDAALAILQRHFDGYQKIEDVAAALSSAYTEVNSLIAPFYAIPTPSAASTVPPWQDIGTAPRDGTPVLLWAEAWEMTWGTQLGAYSVIDQMWETGEGSVSDNDADFDPDDEVDENVEFDATRNVGPTHWAPVPTPPSLPRNDRGGSQS